jgi:hypothetical protein
MAHLQTDWIIMQDLPVDLGEGFPARIRRPHFPANDSFKILNNNELSLADIGFPS